MSAIDVLLIVAGVGWILGRRLVGELLEVKGLLIMPVVLTVIGALQLRHLASVPMTAALFIAVGCALSTGLGLVRGTTVHLGRRDGELWMRYRASSVALWVVNIALKGAMVPVERMLSPGAASAADHAILFSIGLGVLAETAVVLLRAMRADGAVVWSKGEDGAPHQTSEAFERVRGLVNSAAATGGPITAGKRWSLPERDW